MKSVRRWIDKLIRKPTIGIDTQTDDRWIGKHFVMLEIAIPRNSADPGGMAGPGEQSLIELRKMFHQELDEPVPSILLLDASGRPYAEVGQFVKIGREFG